MPEVRTLPSTGVTRLQQYYDPLRLLSGPPCLPWRWVVPDQDRPPPITPHCLASVLCPLPRRIGTGAYIRFPSLLRAAFPVTQSGQHPHRYFRGLLRLHSHYGPLARSVAQGDLCHKASTCSVTQASRLSATRSNRLLSRWNLPPLATRAYGAHWAKSPAAADEMARRQDRTAWAKAHGGPRQ
jgi:hypothetical protein